MIYERRAAFTKLGAEPNPGCQNHQSDVYYQCHATRWYIVWWNICREIFNCGGVASLDTDAWTYTR